jgi:hypothetical protein
VDTLDPWWASSLPGEKHANRDKHRTDATEGDLGDESSAVDFIGHVREPPGEEKHRTEVAAVTEEGFGRNLLNTTEVSG